MRRDDVATRRYGRALFQVAKSLDKIEEFLEEFREVSTILAGNIELRNLLLHPGITTREKKTVMEKIFKEKIDIELLNLIYILLENNRINQIRYVYYDYKYLVYKEKHMKIAYVTTAVEMTGEELEELRKRLSKKYNCDIEVQAMVDSEIIGGVYLRLGDRVLDGTIEGKLKDMRRMLMEKGDYIK